jgi:hypothetical protein|nr:MAG TPA: hypothetical protein [Caudoviricetes sp.]
MKITANSFMHTEAKIVIDGKSYTGAEFNRLVEALHTPSLSANQQVVLEWFKNEKKTQPFATVADFFAAYFEGTEEEVPLNTMVSFEQLTTVEQYQVLAAFAEWGMEQEDKE